MVMSRAIHGGGGFCRLAVKVDRLSPDRQPGALGGGGTLFPNLNRREALGVLGTIGAAASVLPSCHEAGAGHVEVGRYVKRVGVQGKMTGAQAAAAALRCEGVRCVFGIPGAQNNEF